VCVYGYSPAKKVRERKRVFRFFEMSINCHLYNITNKIYVPTARIVEYNNAYMLYCVDSDDDVGDARRRLDFRSSSLIALISSF